MRLQYWKKNWVLQKAKVSGWVETDLHFGENSAAIIRVAELLLL
jgi:hypothetical protein